MPENNRRGQNRGHVVHQAVHALGCRHGTIDAARLRRHHLHAGHGLCERPTLTHTGGLLLHLVRKVGIHCRLDGLCKGGHRVVFFPLHMKKKTWDTQ